MPAKLRRLLLTLFRDLPRRAWLTLRYRGVLTTLWRLVTFPLRLTPLREPLGLAPIAPDPHEQARRWYRRHARPVTVVIVSYGPPGLTLATVESVRRTTDPARVSILVVDDGSAAEHQSVLRERLPEHERILGEENVGFAANVNRGLRAVRGGDVVLLNNDIVAHEGWLEELQWAAHAAADVGIVGPKLLYPDGTIQSAGTHRNLGAPEWFDHRYRFAPSTHGPANIIAPALAMTGACLYLRRSTIDRVGLMDEDFGMAYEDVDYCLRTWQAGLRVLYHPASELTHLESKTRGMVQGEREMASQAHFWTKWADWFDRRAVRTPEGALRIVYVTEDTGVGGGHRVAFQHLNGLRARGHEVELWTLGEDPGWFPLAVPVRTFEDYEELVEALAPLEAIKVATWWNTAAPVWRASVRSGVPVYFVQDIESSYYPGHWDMQHSVLASYRHEFRFLTTSGWVREQLEGLGVQPTAVAPGIDLGTFHELEPPRRAHDVVVALGRTQPLKNFPLTAEAWKAMPEPRPQLWLFGIEPHLGEEIGARYVVAPSDQEVNELYNTATVFVQTSTHEGFCLPILEAMAAGAPVVCTDAHGNRDFCRDGVNCLIPEAEPRAVAGAVSRLMGDEELRRRLASEGALTARRYGWEHQLDEVERFFQDVAVEPVAAG